MSLMVFNVYFQDLNNNIPRCDSDSYTVTVKENLKSEFM